MAKAVIQSNIFTTSGTLDVAGGASVEIRDSVSGALVQVWSDRNGTTLTTNPFNADSNGFFRVYVNQGRVNITATLGAEVQTFNDVEIVRNQELTDSFSMITTSNAADNLHDITVSTGSMIDSTGVNVINVTSSLTKQIDSTWVEGNNVGGLASALTLSADTTYHLFVISKEDGTVDAGWDTDISATNLLADATDYVYFRRIFSNITDSSSNIVNYVQNGNYIYWINATLDYSSASTGTSRVVVPLRVPTGLEVISIVNCEMLNSAAEVVNAWFKSTSFTDVAASGTNRTHSATSYGGLSQQQMIIPTDNLGQVAFRASLSSANNVINLRTDGYIDSLGK